MILVFTVALTILSAFAVGIVVGQSMERDKEPPCPGASFTEGPADEDWLSMFQGLPPTLRNPPPMPECRPAREDWYVAERGVRYEHLGMRTGEEEA